VVIKRTRAPLERHPKWIEWRRRFYTAAVAAYDVGDEIVCIDETWLKAGETVSKGYVDHHVAQHPELLLASGSELHEGLPYAHKEAG